jgi:hypothetical protein
LAVKGRQRRISACMINTFYKHHSRRCKQPRAPARNNHAPNTARTPHPDGHCNCRRGQAARAELALAVVAPAIPAGSRIRVHCVFASCAKRWWDGASHATACDRACVHGAREDGSVADVRRRHEGLRRNNSTACVVVSKAKLHRGVSSVLTARAHVTHLPVAVLSPAADTRRRGGAGEVCASREGGGGGGQHLHRAS